VQRKAKAFCPAGISGFFQICDKEPDGKPITDLERIGARGGFFSMVNLHLSLRQLELLLKCC